MAAAVKAMDVDSVGSAEEKDEKPLALRKTPRLIVGQNPYRGISNQTQTQILTKAKENVDSPSSESKKVSQSSETKTETPADGSRNKRRASDQSNASAGKRKKPNVKETERKHDSYCWSCHKEGVLVGCEVCPRAYHIKCAGLEKEADKDWVCAECDVVLKAENMDMRSNAMRALSVDQLCNLLKFAVSRMRMQCPDEFLKPVPLDVFPNYFNFVVHPMDLETLDKNIKQRMYGCTESFIADTKWILHNCIIFNGYQHKLTSMAKALLKTCKHEMSEIEVCPDCYSNAYTKRENWFQEPCCPPHLLIWAKLKGFPFWPAKAMRIISGNVDVRFFGAHDRFYCFLRINGRIVTFYGTVGSPANDSFCGRAWIPASQCFLLSSDVPTSMKIKKKCVFEHSMEELTQHIKKVKERFHVFQYAPFRAPLAAQDLNIHIQSMLPGVNLKDYCRSSVGTFRYQGAIRQSSSSESSPFSPKERQSSGYMTQSKSIKQESLSPFAAPAKEAGKPTSEGTKSDHSRTVKPRLECMKKLEVAIEKIKSFGKDLDVVLGENLPTEASTSQPSGQREAHAGGEESDGGKDEEGSAAALAIDADATASSPPPLEVEHQLDKEPGDSLPDACEVSSTTCVPEVTGFADECVSTSQSTSSSDVPITALESLENFVETKLPERQQAENSGKTIVPTKDVKGATDDAALESEDTAMVPTAEPVESHQQDGTSGADVGPSESTLPPASPDELPESGLGEMMDTSDEDVSSKTVVFGGGDKLSEGCLLEEEEEVSKETPQNGKREVLPELEPDSKSVEMRDAGKEENDGESEIPVEEKKNEGKMDACSDDADDARSDANESSTIKDRESKEILKESGTEIGAAASAEEGDLVIDLDRDREEEAQNSSKTKKRNSRSPFGGIKLKEKSPPKDKKQHGAMPKTKGKSNPPSERLPVDVGCPPAISTRNLNRVCANLPMLSPLGLRNSVSVLQAQQVSRSMPTLQPRPSISVSSPGSSSSNMCHPSPGGGSGLNKYSQKMVDFVRGTMEEMFHDLAKTGNPEATIKTLQLEMEKMQWHHQQEMAEMKHNTDLILLEMRNSMEAEKQRIVTEVRRQCEIEKQKSLEETKKKQWCAFCGKEAIFYCCWNTSYCDYPCQQAHWPRHVNVCSQTQAGGEQGSKDHATENGMSSARTQSRKHGAKNPKKSEQTSEHQQQQQHQQILMGHPQMHGSGAMASALTSVQVIPQTGLRGGHSLQVQYIGSSPQTSVLPTITMQAPTMTAQFATVATPSGGFPVAQGMSGGTPQGAMFQQRPIQGSNLLFPVVSTHQTRPLMHPSHLPQNTQILVSHGMRSQPSLSFIRGAPHPHRGRPYMM